MPDGNRTNPAILIQAVVGALALILLLIGVLTHGSMMGGMMGGGMMRGWWLLGAFVLSGVVAVVILLVRRAGVGTNNIAKGVVMRSKLWLIAVLMSVGVVAACARKEPAPAAAGGEPTSTPATAVEKTYPLSGKVVSVDASRNEITVDHEKIEGLWEPMTMAFEVRGAEPGSLPAEGSTIRATLHAQDGRYWLTEVRTE